MTFYNSKNHKVEAWQITENIDSPAPSFVTKALLTGMVAPVNAIGGCRGKLHQLRVYVGSEFGRERLADIGDWLVNSQHGLGVIGAKAFSQLYEADAA